MARSFNGSSDVITATAVNPNTFGSSISMAGWVNTVAISGYAAPMAYTGNFGFFNHSGKAAYYITGLTGSTSLDPGTIVLTTNAWVHVGFNFTIGSGGTGYVNGAVDASIPAGTVATNFSSSATILLGNDGSGDFWHGSLADLAVWNVALKASEFASLAAGARPYQIRTPSLVGYWPIDGLQSPEPDLSGFAHNGTLTGTALAAGPPTMMFTPRWPQFPMPAAGGGSAIKFRKTLSQIGGRVGTRQPIGWGM